MQIQRKASLEIYDSKKNNNLNLGDFVQTKNEPFAESETNDQILLETDTNL